MAPPPPSSTRRTANACRTLLCLLLALAPCIAAADGPKTVKPGDPYLTIRLGDLGFEPIQPRILIDGATHFTLNFVDDTHLLVTFSSHGLIPRISDGSSQEDDRLITALLVELPTGSVLASTTWHTRDHEQYLWPLSHGMFLLRIQNHLDVIAPLRGLAVGDAFYKQTFLALDQRIGYISVSPGGDLLLVETVTPPHPEQNDQLGTPQVLHFNSEPTAELRFYRMLFQSPVGDAPRVTAQAAGLIAARNLIRVPATGEGFLDILKESNQTWLFDFQTHAGKRLELSPFDTTCAPSPYFVSRTEFVALGCRGSETRLTLSGFNLRGEQPWIQVLPGQQIAPLLATAPDAGRFAFSRILVTSSFYDLQNLVPEELSGQEIMVIQHHDGRVLLRVQASPIQRSGQNFDISPDGLSFTVIRNANLEVYHLPALTPKDQEQIRLAASNQPERTDDRIRLNAIRPAATAQQPQTPAPEPSPSREPVLTVNGTGATAPAANAGDAPPEDAPRTAPTLYGPDFPKDPKQ